MVHINPLGHNYGPPNLDSVGIAYMTWTVVYSTVLFVLLATVWVHRALPAIRIRDVPLMVTGILFLHVYLVIICSVYVINGRFPCGLEYWVMSLWFPLGIGFFQLQNAQLLIKSIEQNDLLYGQILYKKIGRGPDRFWQRFKYMWSNFNRQQRYAFCIGIAMAIQVVVSLVIFLASRRFHLAFGSVGQLSNAASCRRGWEWIPTIAWQFIWTYFFGPYLLWKIRMIRDIYGWRRQTSIALVAGLPGSPLWLAAVYSPGFGSVNKYWPAPMWFAPGIITMQMVTLAGPLHLIWKYYQYQNLKLDKWNTSSSVDKDPFSTARSGSTGGTYWSPKNNMEALEKTLDTNPYPLQRFSALKEFAGENIQFLVKVRAWKAKYMNISHTSAKMSTEDRRRFFNEGLEIYISYIDPRYSEFTVNLESHIYKSLARVFGGALNILQRRPSSVKSSATPWEEDPANVNESRELFHSDGHESGNESMNGSAHVLVDMPKGNMVKTSSQEAIIPVSAFLADGMSTNPLNLDCEIPPSFNGDVFDEAETSVRYMVLNNSWRNFNNAIEKGSIQVAEVEVASDF